jgi:hypothetical protein
MAILFGLLIAAIGISAHRLCRRAGEGFAKLLFSPHPEI